ncbi:MAG: dTMP kinase [Aeromicrobium erythreum]
MRGAGSRRRARLLADWLGAAGHEVLLTREPGGTEVGARLRGIVLDPATGHLSPRTEALAYAADKAEHVDAVVLPALARGEVVVTDRYVDSTLAYQGAGTCPRRRRAGACGAVGDGRLRPHLTVVLDLDPVVGLARAGEPDRIEAEPLDFHQRVRSHFLALAAADPAHYLVVDADQSPDVVHAAVRAAVEPWLGQAR